MPAPIQAAAHVGEVFAIRQVQAAHFVTAGRFALLLGASVRWRQRRRHMLLVLSGATSVSALLAALTWTAASAECQEHSRQGSRRMSAQRKLVCTAATSCTAIAPAEGRDANKDLQ